ncbi:hypothetical protein QR680_018394 [Steinernema hermaphroditum]|uniref:Uncharacterized protein n=1 Tax=Steinernema hermaphroditum TaxID=289476 RepID=A0AA39HHU0_9BILA|nr:hypothetical protein QR680_018394 [Steinernema hermaphroditum]
MFSLLSFSLLHLVRIVSGDVLSQNVGEIAVTYVDPNSISHEHPGYLSFPELVKQKNRGNELDQCPCVSLPGSGRCITYDSRFQAANIPEAVISFVDLSLDGRNLGEPMDSVIKSGWFNCDSQECRNCAAFVFYRLKRAGLVLQSEAFPFPLPEEKKLSPGMCQRLRMGRRVFVPDAPPAAPYVEQMIEAGAREMASQPQPPATGLSGQIDQVLQEEHSREAGLHRGFGTTGGGGGGGGGRVSPQIQPQAQVPAPAQPPPPAPAAAAFEQPPQPSSAPPPLQEAPQPVVVAAPPPGQEPHPPPNWPPLPPPPLTATISFEDLLQPTPPSTNVVSPQPQFAPAQLPAPQMAQFLLPDGFQQVPQAAQPNTGFQAPQETLQLSTFQAPQQTAQTGTFEAPQSLIEAQSFQQPQVQFQAQPQFAQTVEGQAPQFDAQTGFQNPLSVGEQGFQNVQGQGAQGQFSTGETGAEGAGIAGGEAGRFGGLPQTVTNLGFTGNVAQGQVPQAGVNFGVSGGEFGSQTGGLLQGGQNLGAVNQFLQSGSQALRTGLSNIPGIGQQQGSLGGQGGQGTFGGLGGSQTGIGAGAGLGGQAGSEGHGGLGGISGIGGTQGGSTGLEKVTSHEGLLGGAGANLGGSTPSHGGGGVESSLGGLGGGLGGAEAGLGGAAGSLGGAAGGLGGGLFGRKKRQAAQPPVLGERFVISCVERGEPESEETDLLNLCTACWTWRQLPADYFPRLVNELVCKENDFCLSGWGSCQQRYRNLDVLRRVQGDWVPTTISIATCCDCRVKAGTEAHPLVVGNKKMS